MAVAVSDALTAAMQVPSIAIPPELNATIGVPVIPFGVQPRLQLALDFPMVRLRVLLHLSETCLDKTCSD